MADSDDLLDAYVDEVGHRMLFVRGREARLASLRQTLAADVAERAASAGTAPTVETAIAVLRAHGSPDRAANALNPTPYVIGPRLYPAFTRVLTIVLGAVALGLAVATAVQIASLSAGGPAEIAGALARGFAGLLSAWVGAFGWVALIFAAIERFAPVRAIAVDGDGAWDPQKLQRRPPARRVKPAEAIAAILFGVIALAIFAVNPDVIGIYYLADGRWRTLPLLSDAFFRWLPLLSAIWVGDIALHAFLLRRGEWSPALRICSMLLKAAQIAMLLVLLAGPSVLAISPDSLTTAGMPRGETAEALSQVVHGAVRLALAFGALGATIDIVRGAFRLASDRRD